MPGLSYRLLGALGALACLAVAEPAAAQVSNQTILNRLDHVPQAWSRKLGANRFALVLDNQAVLDKETGLVWERALEPRTSNFALAAFGCWGKEVAGRAGWRVPTVEELRSLVDPARANPALPAGHPFLNVTTTTFYWSVTPSLLAGPERVVIDFSDGGLALQDDNAVTLPVWCVRGSSSDIQDR